MFVALTYLYVIQFHPVVILFTEGGGGGGPIRIIVQHLYIRPPFKLLALKDHLCIKMMRKMEDHQMFTMTIVIGERARRIREYCGMAEERWRRITPLQINLYRFMDLIDAWAKKHNHMVHLTDETVALAAVSEFCSQWSLTAVFMDINAAYDRMHG